MSGLGVGNAQAQAVNWTGNYIGAYAGWAWARSHASTIVDCSFDPFGDNYMCDSGDMTNGLAVGASGTGWMSANTFIYGVQAGHNWQNEHWVYGFEADFGSFNLRGSRQSSGLYPDDFNGNVSMVDNYTIGTGFSTTWLITARGRYGWTTDNVWREHDSLWIYATGGLALTDLHVSFNFIDDEGATGNGSASRTLLGYAIGAGLEYKLNNRWSVKAEYLHLGFGHVCASGLIIGSGGYANGISTCADLTADLARLGLNYKL